MILNWAYGKLYYAIKGEQQTSGLASILDSYQADQTQDHFHSYCVYRALSHQQVNS